MNLPQGATLLTEQEPEQRVNLPAGATLIEEENPDTPTDDQIKSSMMSFGEKTAVAGPFVAAYDKIMEKINGTEQERTRGYLALTYAQVLNLQPSFAYRHKESIDNWFKTRPEEAAKRDAIMAKIRAYNDTGMEGDSYLTRMYKALRRVPFQIQEAAGGIVQYLEESRSGLTPGMSFMYSLASEDEKKAFHAAAEAIEAKNVKTGLAIQKEAKEKQKQWEPDVIPGSFKDVVGMATETTVNNLMLLATLGPFGRGAYLTGFGAQAFGQSYPEQREGGSAFGTATIASLINAGSEVATEFIPSGIYLKPSRRLVEQFVKAQFAEIPGESINQIVNDVVDKVTIRPEMTLAQAIDNVVTTIQVTALSTSALATTTHSVNKVLSKTLAPTHGDIIKQEVDKALLNGDTPQAALKKGIDAAAQTPEGKQIIDDKVNQLKKEAADFEKERSTKPFIIGTEETEQGDVSKFIMADPVTGRTFTVPAIMDTEKGEKVNLIPDSEAVAMEMEKIRLAEDETFDQAVTQFLESGQDADTLIDTLFGQESELTEAQEGDNINVKIDLTEDDYEQITRIKDTFRGFVEEGKFTPGQLVEYRGTFIQGISAKIEQDIGGRFSGELRAKIEADLNNWLTYLYEATNLELTKDKTLQFGKSQTRTDTSLLDKAKKINDDIGEKGSIDLEPIVNLGRSIWEEGHTSYKAFEARAKELLADVWDKVKQFIKEAWDIINNERGSFSTKKTGAQNLITRIIELGGINFGKDYNTRLLRQDKDTERVIRKTGKSPDAMAAILQAEGWQIESSDHMVELLKSGEARKIYAPTKSDEMLKRDAEKEVEAWVKGNLAELGIEYKDVKQIKSELKKAQKEYRAGNKDVKAEVKKNLLWIARRLESLRNIRDSLNLTEEQMRKVSRRNPLLMDAAEFKKYLNAVELRALELAEERHARESLVKLIADKNLQKVDNYRRALELPPINQMNTQQLNTFFELLEMHEDDDVFLTERELETVDRTEFKGVRTWREVRQKIAEKLGIPPEDIKPVHSDWMDSYRWDTALREQGPIYQLVVETMTRKQIAAELRAHEIESEVYAMAKKAHKSSPKTLTEKLIPQDEKIIAYLEAPAEEKSKVAATMTKEELALAHYAQQYYADFLQYLLSIRAIDRGRQNYFTHVRRSFLETVKDEGIKAAFTNYFKNMEQDQIVFNILDDDTGKILPLEKFFQFSMRRTGGLQPTQNFVKAFMTYVNTAEKKRMYDETIPLLDIIAQAVTPQEFTPRGLEIDRSFKTFINKWINNKKGRRISFDSALRQGGKLDVAIRAMQTFTVIRDLGLNIPIGIAATMGEQVTNFVMLGWEGWTKGTARMRTDQGKKIIKKYEGWVGRSVWEELSAPGKQISERLVEGMMSLFRLATVTANKQFLLGSMTDAEFQSGEISEQRLAELRLDMGRFRVVEGTSSLVGSTSVGSAGVQYKKWAVPILRTTVQDNKKTISDLKTKPYGEKMASKEAQEVKRILYISGTMFIVGALIGADDDDDSVFGKLKGRVYREGMTLIQGISPRLWLTSPRVLTFLYQLGDLLESVIRLETYKRTGELKAWNKAKRTFVPVAVAPLINDEKKKERR